MGEYAVYQKRAGKIFCLMHPLSCKLVTLPAPKTVAEGRLYVMDRDVKEDSRKGPEAKPARRRRRARTFTLRNVVTLIIVLGFLAVLSMLYSQLWPRRP